MKQQADHVNAALGILERLKQQKPVFYSRPKNVEQNDVPSSQVE